jgi:alkylation response protein AidB-like acyl-CoA dehydrogenase
MTRERGDGIIMTASEAAASLDQATLDALRESVAGVLAEQSGGTQVHAFIDGKNALDRDLWAQAASLGWLGFGIPEAHGGLGLGVRGLAILHTELGRQGAPGPYIPTLAAAQAIMDHGTDEARATWLPRIAAGEISAAVPVAPDAVKAGTIRCLGAPDAAIVLAPAGSGWGIYDLTGGTVAAVAIWDRTRTVIDVTLGDAKPVALLGEGASVAVTLARSMALAIAADCLGASQSVTERTIAYMKTREQFGQPIAGFQALKHRAADLATKLAVMEETLAHAVDRTAAVEPDADIWVMLAKAETTESAVFIATDCVQLHGGVGFTWDYDPQFFLKRARLNEVLVASNPALRDRAATILATLTRDSHSALELGL